jgi:O-antigen ligase
MNQPSSAGADRSVRPELRPVSRDRSDRPALKPLEWAVLFHVASMFAFASWAFGGGADWVRTALAAWGSLAVVIIVAFVRDPTDCTAGRLRPLRCLWPLAAFDLLTLVACLSPSFRPILAGSETMLVKIDLPSWRPSSALPASALYELWLFNALYLSAFNLALVLRQRRALRGLLMFAGANALALAVFGTLQKLAGSTGLFFDRVPSPQPFFFSSFVYHNHWGSFALLMAAACLGLVWYYAKGHEARDFLHSPALTWVVVVLALAAAVPLSGSRSCSLLMLALLVGASVHTLANIVRGRRRYGESVALPLTAAALTAVLAAGAVWFVARDSITTRFEQSRQQVVQFRETGSIGSRAVLYRDTWAMARDNLWFGWGTGSYTHVFLLYNTVKPGPDLLIQLYRDAHSDWLQSVAEHGLVGTALVGLCALVPLAGLRRRDLSGPLATYPLVGCGLVLLYAWVEFPFGNAAVVLAWWLAFFCATRYARLEAAAEDSRR